MSNEKLAEHEKICDRIKIIRKRNGLTQKEFADKLNITASYISEIEAGKKIPSPAIISLMSLRYNIRESWLARGDGEPYTKDAGEENTAIGDAELNDIVKRYPEIEMILDEIKLSAGKKEGVITMLRRLKSRIEYALIDHDGYQYEGKRDRRAK